MALIKCTECGKEISDKANICPNCGCPVGRQNVESISSSLEQSDINQAEKKSVKKVIMITIIVSLVISGIIIYNIKVVQPKRLEAQNKVIYEDALDLLEKGKYDEGNELLQTIIGYQDVNILLEQIKWESLVYECITDLRSYLKNPDSLQVYEVAFYEGYKEGIDDELKDIFEPFLKMMSGKPVCIMKEGAQNGFGGNTIGYALFLYLEDEKAYKYVGSCDTLGTEEIDADDKEEYVICGMINAYKDTLKQVSNVDLERIKNIIKNDAYTTIKIIE